MRWALWCQLCCQRLSTVNADTLHLLHPRMKCHALYHQTLSQTLRLGHPGFHCAYGTTFNLYWFKWCLLYYKMQTILLCCVVSSGQSELSSTFYRQLSCVAASMLGPTKGDPGVSQWLPLSLHLPLPWGYALPLVGPTVCYALFFQHSTKYWCYGSRMGLLPDQTLEGQEKLLGEAS